jgi:L-fuconolactonase
MSRKIVDAHHHLCDRGRFRYQWLADRSTIHRDFLPRDYAQAIEDTDVDRSVHVQADVDECFALQETRWVLKSADDEGPVEAVVGWAPVEKKDDLSKYLDDLGEHPRLKGFRRLIQGESADFAARDELIEGVRALGERGYSFDVCIRHHQLASVVELARECPQTAIVLDHVGKPDIAKGELEPWTHDLKQLASLQHVYCKLSGMVTEADWSCWTVDQLKPFAQVVIDAFGFDRLMFGSDWPVSTLAADYKRWLYVVDELIEGATGDQQCALFEGTATSFYRLST